MHVKILGKRYRLRFKKLSSGVLGECDDPMKSGKEIRIAQGIGEKETLDVIIHEALHAADWHKGEPWVEEVATDLARLLWRLGYRRKGSEDLDNP